MARTPEPHEIDTLQAISDLENYGWSRLDKFDPRQCIEAGWIVSHSLGYRLTGTGREVLAVYGKRQGRSVPPDTEVTA